MKTMSIGVMPYRTSEKEYSIFKQAKQRIFLYLTHAKNVPLTYLAIASSIVGLHSSKIIKSKSNRLIIAAERKLKNKKK